MRAPPRGGGRSPAAAELEAEGSGGEAEDGARGGDAVAEDAGLGVEAAAQELEWFAGEGDDADEAA
jgi:hypothetical protein